MGNDQRKPDQKNLYARAKISVPSEAFGCMVFDQVNALALCSRWKLFTEPLTKWISNLFKLWTPPPCEVTAEGANFWKLSEEVTNGYCA